MPLSVPPFEDLLGACRRSAVHLEMRDSYGVDDEADDFARWQATGKRDVDPTSVYWAPWVELIGAAVARGVVVRRARIVSEPVTDYIRYEHAGSDVNVAAGEQVRWLPRRQASTIPLPGNDFWLLDSRLVRFGHFSGGGDFVAEERTEDPAVVQLCSTAFETVWERAIPHDQYKIR